MSFYDRRPILSTDYGKVIDAWVGACREGSQIYQWDALGHRLLLTKAIRDVLNRTACRGMVACDPEDPDVILGFTISTGPVLHFAWVRGDQTANFRKQGIVPALLEGAQIEAYSFKTDIGIRRLKPQARGWAYAPHVAEFCNGKLKVEIAA